MKEVLVDLVERKKKLLALGRKGGGYFSAALLVMICL